MIIVYNGINGTYLRQGDGDSERTLNQYIIPDHGSQDRNFNRERRKKTSVSPETLFRRFYDLCIQLVSRLQDLHVMSFVPGNYIRERADSEFTTARYPSS